MHEKKVALGSSTPEPNKALEPTIMHTIHAKACGYLGWLNILVKQDRVEMELNLLHAGLSPHCFLSICYFAVVTETKKGRVDANGHVSIGRSPWSLGPPHLNYWETLCIYTASRHREIIRISVRTILKNGKQEQEMFFSEKGLPQLWTFTSECLRPKEDEIKKN